MEVSAASRKLSALELAVGRQELHPAATDPSVGTATWAASSHRSTAGRPGIQFWRRFMVAGFKLSIAAKCHWDGLNEGIDLPYFELFTGVLIAGRHHADSAAIAANGWS